jgi:hypothetical protein
MTKTNDSNATPDAQPTAQSYSSIEQPGGRCSTDTAMDGGSSRPRSSTTSSSRPAIAPAPKIEFRSVRDIINTNGQNYPQHIESRLISDQALSSPLRHSSSRSSSMEVLLGDNSDGGKGKAVKHDTE